MKVRNSALSASKLIGAVALSAVLVACGGGTSGDATDGLGDLDAGSDDLGLTDGGTDIGLTDGDTTAGADPFDSDGNGIPDENETLVCKGLGGSDPGSNNENWDDNCYLDYDINRDDPDSVTRSPFYHSTYVQGVQRILFCRESAGTADDINAWSDGFFGINTFNAVVAFQAAEGLLQDGRVGPETWGRMQTLVDDVSLVVDADSDAFYNAYGIARVDAPATLIDCSQQTNFFGEFATEAGSQDFFDGWELSKVAGENIKGAFSIEAPTGVLSVAD